MCSLDFSTLFSLGPPGFINLTSFSLHVLSKINISYYSLLLLTLYTVLGKSIRKPEIVDQSAKEYIENFDNRVIQALENIMNSTWFLLYKSFPGMWSWEIKLFLNMYKVHLVYLRVLRRPLQNLCRNLIEDSSA